MADSWVISRTKGCCSSCGVRFPPGSAFYSALEETEADFRRLDFCEQCWEAKRNSPFFCFWRSRHRTAERPRRVDVNLMVEFFERLEGADSPNKQVLRFVLALLLMRRKRLRLLAVRRGPQGEVMELEWRPSGRRITVSRPPLGEEEIRHASERLGELLDGEL